MSDNTPHPRQRLPDVRIQDLMDETTTTPRSTPISRGDGGARRDRTDDLMLAKHALSQLSYGPGERQQTGRHDA